MTTLKTHYDAGGLRDWIFTGIDTVTRSKARLTIDDLAPLDEFHLRGPAATTEIIGQLAIDAEARVLDVGSGLGGPARRLAATTGCSVVGIDLNPGYCAIGNELSSLVGLDDRVELEAGNAADLSHLDDVSFDAAWTLHVGMNIADKASVYAGVARVLRPGAPFIVYDILSAGRGAPEYPQPWASEPGDSFLVEPDELLSDLRSAGFDVHEVVDKSEGALEFLDRGLARAEASGPPPLGIHLIFGSRFRSIVANGRRALADGLLVPTMIRATRVAS